MTPVVRGLIIANVIAYLLQAVTPGMTSEFLFYPALFLIRPWTIVTYMFLHGGLTHIFFNMLGLYWFGPRVEGVIGAKRFTYLYFISGIAGAALSFALAFNSPILGASAGVFGVSLAYAWFWPNQVFYIWGVLPMSASMMVVFNAVISFWFGFGGAQGGVAHFAHLGGYGGAFLYLKWLNRARGSFKRKVATASPAVTKALDGWKSIDVTRIHEINRVEVNRLLDKISAQGVASLTGEERLFLSNFVPKDETPPIQ